MKSLQTVFAVWACLVISITGQSQETTTSTEAQQIIQAFVEDYQNDRFAKEIRTVGIEVPHQGKWTIESTGKQVDQTWEVLMKEGLPETPTYIYTIELATLRAIYEGAINALTAQGKAFAGDYTPMSVREQAGFDPSGEEDGKLNAFSFHFWTRGFPEIIPFNPETTRRAHGSNFTIFYYQKGLRTAWYRVLPNEKVRHDPREQAMPFPMLIVAMKGVTKGEVDGQPVSLAEGNAIFIPPGAKHKWWNETTEATEAILIMFGEGA